jgi:hypothetical protein
MDIKILQIRHGVVDLAANVGPEGNKYDVIGDGPEGTRFAPPSSAVARSERRGATARSLFLAVPEVPRVLLGAGHSNTERVM